MRAQFQSERLVLGRSPQDEAIDDLAEEQGWQFVEEGFEDGARRRVWAVGPGSSLTTSRIPFRTTRTPCWVSHDRGTYDRLLELIDYELMPFQPKALLTSVDEARDPLNRARAVIQLGLGAPGEYVEDVRVRDAFASPEELIREAAIWATTYSPWPQYRPLRQAAAQDDPEPKLRTDAATVLAIRHLVTVVAGSAVEVPAGRLVEALAAGVVRQGPENRFWIAGGECLQGHVHQASADAGTPVRRIHSDRVEFAQSRIDRVSTRPDPDQPGDRAVVLRNAPGGRAGSQIFHPSADPPVVQRDLRHQFA